MPHSARRVWALFQDYDRWPDYAPMVLRVEVLWPGGRVDTWRDLPADREHALVEGRT